MSMPGIFDEAMEELRLLGAIDALESVLACKFNSGGERCDVVTAEDIQELIEVRKCDLLRLRAR